MSSRVRKLLTMGLGSALVAAVGLSACQNYELEQVEPKAFAAVKKDVVVVGKTEKPYIMLVIDKSGSMLERADSPREDLKCRTGEGIYDPAKPCKWSDLLEAFAAPSTGFLRTSENLALFGLSAFPEGVSCDAGELLVPLNVESSNVDSIMAKLDAISPAGGTPVAPTLESLALDPTLSDPEAGRMRFVMLLTDGLPNCNPSPENVEKCALCNDGDPTTPCRDLTQNACYPTFNIESDYCDNGFAGVPLGSDCLDMDGTVRAIQKLREKGVETFVLGFGLDTAVGSVGAQVLDAAAEAGGRARSEGGAKYYQAGNRQELQAALKAIIDVVQSCDFSLDPAPSSENVLQVIVYDSKEKAETTLKKGSDWSFSTPSLNAITFGESWCNTLQNAPPNRYELRFRYATSM